MNNYSKFLASSLVAALAISVTPQMIQAEEIKASTWSQDAVNYLSENGLIAVEGYQPSKDITRGEMVKLLALSLGLVQLEEELPMLTTPLFKDTAGHWSEPYLQKLIAHNPNIFNGYNDGTFKPDNNIRRDEMAKVMTVAYDLKKNPNLTVNFTDVQGWAKEYIDILAMNGIVAGTGNSKYNPATYITNESVALLVHRVEVEEVRVAKEENSFVETRQRGNILTYDKVVFPTEYPAINSLKDLEIFRSYLQEQLEALNNYFYSTIKLEVVSSTGDVNVYFDYYNKYYIGTITTDMKVDFSPNLEQTFTYLSDEKEELTAFITGAKEIKVFTIYGSLIYAGSPDDLEVSDLKETTYYVEKNSTNTLEKSLFSRDEQLVDKSLATVLDLFAFNKKDLIVSLEPVDYISMAHAQFRNDEIVASVVKNKIYQENPQLGRSPYALSLEFNEKGDIDVFISEKDDFIHSEYVTTIPVMNGEIRTVPFKFNYFQMDNPDIWIDTYSEEAVREGIERELGYMEFDLDSMREHGYDLMITYGEDREVSYYAYLKANPTTKILLEKGQIQVRQGDSHYLNYNDYPSIDSMQHVDNKEQLLVDVANEMNTNLAARLGDRYEIVTKYSSTYELRIYLLDKETDELSYQDYYHLEWMDDESEYISLFNPDGYEYEEVIKYVDARAFDESRHREVEWEMTDNMIEMGYAIELEELNNGSLLNYYLVNTEDPEVEKLLYKTVHVYYVDNYLEFE